MMVVDRKEVPTTLVRHSGVVPQSFLRLAGFKVLLPEGEGFRVRVKKWDAPIQHPPSTIHYHPIHEDDR